MRGFPVSQQKVTGTVIQVPSSISTTAVWLGLFNLNWPSLIILYNMCSLQCSTFSLSSSTRLSWIVGYRSFFVQVPSLSQTRNRMSGFSFNSQKTIQRLCQGCFKAALFTETGSSQKPQPLYFTEPLNLLA